MRYRAAPMAASGRLHSNPDLISLGLPLPHELLVSPMNLKQNVKLIFVLNKSFSISIIYHVSLFHHRDLK